MAETISQLSTDGNFARFNFLLLIFGDPMLKSPIPQNKNQVRV